MKSKTKKIIASSVFCATLNFVLANYSTVEASYSSKSDTGTEIFDYIENRRIEERAKALTEEQKKLIEDIDEAKNRLPKPIEEGKPIPAAFVGDDLVYNAATGEFIATGNVDIIQLEGYRFQSEEAEGNIKTQDVKVRDKAHVLQINPESPRVTLDGYNTVYNYGTKTGTMGEAKGKAADYYISGKRFEFYPDHIVAYDATQTKCNAKIPDYQLSAERMEIWPEQIMRMYKVKLWIKGKMVGKKDYEERRLDDDSETYFPRVGYNSDDGAYVEDTFEFPFKDAHWKTLLNAYANTKKGIRSSGELVYSNRGIVARGIYGYYRDDNSNWIQKEPGLDIYYKHHLENSPLEYTVEYEIGHWRSEDTKSLHQEFEVGLSHDPIDLPGNFKLMLHTSYKITTDQKSTGDKSKSDVRGMNYDVILGKEFDDRFAAYTAYHYTKNNTRTALYKINLEDYSSRFETGISYRLTDKDRFVAGWKFDTQTGQLKDTDFYWYRDLHCSTAVLRWRHKRKKVEFHWQFTPW
ncbi:MAG: LPS-assembly protein LptD [Selenomonadaceae bacterium]|nr:LPS-assembly protein LptD [Selenomonadaceae bacterium]